MSAEIITISKIKGYDRVLFQLKECAVLVRPVELSRLCNIPAPTVRRILRTMLKENKVINRKFNQNKSFYQAVL